MNRGKIVTITIFIGALIWAQANDSTRIVDPLQISNEDSLPSVEQILGLTDDVSDSMQVVSVDSTDRDSTFSPLVISIADSDSTVSPINFNDSIGVAINTPDTIGSVFQTTDSIGTVLSTDEISDSLNQVVESQEPPDLSLDYGYKGYRWGTMSGIHPRIERLTEPFYSRDSSSVTFRTVLGPDTVLMSYFYSDSGFWKVEISYPLDPFDQDAHDKKFQEISQILTQLYSNPTGSSLSITGPMMTSSNPLDIDYSRNYQHNSWQAGPVQIELLLISFVQDTQTIYPVLSGTSQLKLAYYNPDYMIRVEPHQPVDTGPSVFDLY
ncbi:MAG: hypothetical protein GXO90_07965 [FCB group bacterium]|nr:hypothetical protein [FCB group bacterium]